MEGEVAAEARAWHLPEVRGAQEDRLPRDRAADAAPLPGALDGPHRARGLAKGGVALPAGADGAGHAHHR
eukprot:13846049-Alexandrium_andersonii.AAC.1